jgi:tryptophan-rich sensory protein
MEEAMAVILMGVLLFVVVFGSLFGADSRPGWRNVNRKPRFRMTGSMRPSDWERD